MTTRADVRPRRGLVLAAVLVAAVNPLYAWAVSSGIPAPVAGALGPVLIVLALGIHTATLAPLCRGVLRAAGAALLTLALVWVTTWALASLAYDLWGLLSTGGLVAGLIAGLVAGMIAPFPAYLLVGRGVRAVLLDSAPRTRAAGGAAPQPTPSPGRR